MKSRAPTVPPPMPRTPERTRPDSRLPSARPTTVRAGRWDPRKLTTAMPHREDPKSRPVALPLLGRAPTEGAGAFAPLATGFRPFFLLAALSAVGLVPYWLGQLLFGVSSRSPLSAQVWHAHEMLFGYTVAVIAGFLLTAVQNWTGLPTVRRGRLLALSGLWCCGRLATGAGAFLPAWLAAAIDLSFLPVLALVVAVPIARTRNRRQAGMPALLLVLAGANLLVWVGALTPDATQIARGQRLALDVVALLIVVIGGRVLPGFTANAVPGLSVRLPSRLDSLAIAAMAALLLADALVPGSLAAPLCAALASGLNAARLFGWGGARTLTRPILLVLHAGFASTAAALGLRALALLSGAISESTATHLLTVGGIGAMTLGMMARVSLGHTGRPLRLPRSIVFALALVGASALVRVVGAVCLSSHYREVLLVAGTLWTAAFVLYLVYYTPILLAARPDGRPG